MDKMDMKTKNIVSENVKKISSLFPNTITETTDRDGNITKKIDFDVLKQELSDDIVNCDKERYVLTWPGKKESILLANSPTNETLRPRVDDSIDFNNTKNLYIEGDNLGVLKLLRETYLGKIKMIYIDPPYNTGGDMIYNDKFDETIDIYLDESFQINDDNNRMVANLESDGRFHSKWLSMMYPRLKIAKDLLSDDGVLFVSIDDNELNNLITILKEIYSDDNVFSTITVKTNETKGLKNSNVNKGFPKNKEYIIAVAKNKVFLNLNVQRISKTNDELKNYCRYYRKYIKNVDEDCSKWVVSDFEEITKGMSNDEIFASKIEHGKELIYLVAPDNVDIKKVPEERNRFYKIVNNKGTNTYYYRDNNGSILTTLFLSNYLDKNLGDLWTDISTININKENCGVPTYSNGQKPIKLLKRLINYAVKPNEDAIICDFFSGSATTAQAVLELNEEDGGNRKYIMVQIPEEANDKRIKEFLIELDKPPLITELGKERLKRFASINNGSSLDTGFRVLKLDSSNMKDVYYNPNEYTPDLFSSLEDNINEGRTNEDLLFQVMLDLGIMLDSKIEEKTISGKKIFVVTDEDKTLICCFDKDVTDDVVTEIAKSKPDYAVFRDSSMSSDSVAINFEQIFKTYSPSTTRKVL